MEAIATDAASSITSQIANFSVDFIKRQAGYLIFYNRKLNILNQELQKLYDMKTAVDKQVDAALRNLQEANPAVVSWQNQVNEVQSKAAEFRRNNMYCFDGMCPNLKSRYFLGRKAAKLTENVLTLLQEGGKFTNQIAFPAGSPHIGSSFFTEGIKLFESRRTMENQVWEALKNGELGIISICGMGGVGKTTLVKKLLKRVKDEKLFDEVAMAVVSQNPDVETIQGEIAHRLGLKLEQGMSVLIKADKLNERIKSTDKSFLLILDDVWKELDFEAIGLPSAGAKGRYKIVLTSRKEDVCNNIGSKKNFLIHVLPKEEAWDLFKEMAGNSIDNDLNQTAMEIANECGGLPIAIVTVAKALKNKPKEIWDDALQQLRNSNLESISGMQESVHSRIELSYNLLGGEEAKSCFLLCCLFPEDYNVRVEDLVRYGLSMGLFKNVEYVHQARNRVHTLLHELKESFLLFEGDSNKYESVKMHDLVRDVALSIASKDKHYVVSCDAGMKIWPREIEKYQDCTAISLVRREVKEHPVTLELPKLQFLRLAYGDDSEPLPNNLLAGARELKVVSLEMLSLPQPLDVLKKLVTLQLQMLPPGDISTIGALISLEILEIGSDAIKELPAEIGQLKNLRLLDLRGMSRLRYIASGVLSELCNLEELYVRDEYRNWGITEEDGKKNARVSEIESHHITALQIGVPNPSVLPKESVYIKVTKFKIVVGKISRSTFHKDSVNELQLSGNGSEIRESGICNLFKRTQVLTLEGVNNLKNVDAMNKDAIRQISCFNNLRDIRIDECDELKYVFPLSMARGLSQLESIYIYDCKKMEGLFYGEDGDGDCETDKYLPKLNELTLESLPKLIGVRAESSILRNQENAQFFPSHWLQITNLQYLMLFGCGLLKVAFPLSVAQQLVQLKSLRIVSCQQLQYIVAEEKNEDNRATTKIVFPMLMSIKLVDLLELVAFCPHSHISFYCPLLKEIEWRSCRKLKTFCPSKLNPNVYSMDNDSYKDRNEFESKRMVCPWTRPSCSMLPTILRRGRQQRNVDSTLPVPRDDSETKQQFASTSNQLEQKDSCGGTNEQRETCCAFPSKSIQEMPNLKQVDLRYCEALEVIFSYEEWHSNNVDGAALLNVSEELVLYELSNVVHVWWINNIINPPPPATASFQNLKVLAINNCGSLINVLSSSGSILDDEYIKREEIKIIFPQLRTLQLWDLPKLRSFCMIDALIEMPVLEEFQLYKCNQMKSFFYFRGSVITPKLEKIKINEHVYPLKKKDLNATLEEVMSSILFVENDIIPDLHGDSTKLIRNLEVRYCKTLLNPLPCNLIGSLQNLEKLNVRWCDSIVEIFEEHKSEGEGEGEGENNYVTTSLFPNLEEIHLCYLPKLEHIFPQINGFQKLTTLRVERCNSLRNVFSISVAKGLVQLQVLQIKTCDMLKEILIDEEEEEEEGNDKILVFPQLKSVELYDLPKLMSFYNGRSCLEFPLLEELQICYCDQMKTFSHGSLITSKLHKLLWEYVDTLLIGDGDLNAAIYQLFKSRNKEKEDAFEIKGAFDQVEVDVTKVAPTLTEFEPDQVDLGRVHTTKYELSISEEEATDEEIDILKQEKQEYLVAKANSSTSKYYDHKETNVMCQSLVEVDHCELYEVLPNQMRRKKKQDANASALPAQASASEGAKKATLKSKRMFLDNNLNEEIQGVSYSSTTPNAEMQKTERMS